MKMHIDQPRTYQQSFTVNDPVSGFRMDIRARLCDLTIHNEDVPLFIRLVLRVYYMTAF